MPYLRVRLIEVPRSGDKASQEFGSVQELSAHLARAESNPLAQRCRVYVVEGLGSEYVDFLGRHFGIDPTLLAYQIGPANWEGKQWANNTPKLLLSQEPRQTFTLRYGELRSFEETLAGLVLRDSVAGRKIFSIKNSAGVLSDFTKVGLLRRCISFWCRESYAGCWDGNFRFIIKLLIILVVILVDPPVVQCFNMKPNFSFIKKNFPNDPYDSGYVDFTL
jgi:hypothetical protein